MDKTFTVFGYQFQRGLFLAAVAVALSLIAFTVAGSLFVTQSTKFQDESLARRKLTGQVIQLTCKRENNQADASRNLYAVVLAFKPKKFKDKSEALFYRRLQEAVSSLVDVNCKQLVKQFQEGVKKI